MQIIKYQKSAEKQLLRLCTTILKTGGLIVYPTETCYGLGADSTNPKAIKKLLSYKGQRLGKAISIAAADQKMAQNYVYLNKTAKNLYQNFLPGPLTVVSQSKGKVVSQLESNRKTLGIRIPAYAFALEIINHFGQPITATSANTSGKKPPYSLKDFLKYTSLKKQKIIDLFIDAGKLPPRLPSSVVDTTLNEPKILRQGEIFFKPIKNQLLFSYSAAETKKISQKIFKHYQFLLKKQPLIFALQGELGTGKTQFAKGLALALKIKANITSPTFVFLKEYPYYGGIFYHLDTWRMTNGQDLLALGFKKMLVPGNVIAIEWLQKVKPLLEKLKIKIVWINFDYGSTLNKRRISYLLK